MKIIAADIDKFATTDNRYKGIEDCREGKQDEIVGCDDSLGGGSSVSSTCTETPARVSCGCRKMDVSRSKL